MNNMADNIIKIKRDIKNANEDVLAETKIYVPDESNLYHLIGSIKGPPGTPYEGGTFLLEIQLDDNYPFAPPYIRFITKTYHPNICSETGAIASGFFEGDEWSPAMNFITILLTLQVLLSSPYLHLVQDHEAASLYASNFDVFNMIATLWTANFANVTLDDYIANSVLDTLNN